MADDTLKSDDTSIELATFYVGDALCGLDILTIQEINKHFDITKVPQAPDYVVGILNLRGRIVTVIDLGKKIGLSEIKKSKDNRNVIVNSEDEHIGLIVDSISDMVRGGQEDIKEAPSNLSGIKGKFFSGVLKTRDNLVGILDIDEVLKE